MKSSKVVLAAVVAVLVSGYFIFDLGQYFSLDYFKSQQAAFDGYFQHHPLLTAGLFFLVYVAVTGLSLPGAALMTLAAGALFGLLWGTLIVSFASTLGATIAFLVSRYLLRDAVQRRFGDKLKTVNEGMEREGAFYLFTLRLVPVFPFFVINLVMGLMPIRPLTYAFVSQAGMLAGTIVYVNAGTEMAKIDSLGGILSPGLLLSFALLGLFPLIAKKMAAAIRARKVLKRYPRPRTYDRNLVVIGGGSAGLVTSLIGAAVKAEVTLIEKHKMGGDCLNTGCVPSKALIRSARFVAQQKRAAALGMQSASVEFDFADVMARVQRVIKTIEPHDSAARFRSLGVDVIEGEAKIVSPYCVEVNGQRITTRNIVIATGARPFVPPLPGLDAVGYLTSDTVWNLRRLPKRLVVLGGGPIGCELAQSFARLGSQVIQIERGPRLMGREDEDISHRVMARFEAEGIDLRLSHSAKAFCLDAGEKVLVCEHQGEEVRIAFDEVLVALGRVANTQGFGLEALGVNINGTITVNERLQTNFPNIYAAGDVAGPYQFTHTAAHQAWYAAVNALFSGFKSFKVDYRVIPWATFTDPEVARVGLNEQEAKAQGIEYELTCYGIDDLDRAIVDEEAYGVIKVLTVPGRDKILGVTIVAEHAGDLIAEYVSAMKHGLGLNKILGTIHIYPTMAEANKYVAGHWKRAHAPQRLLAWVERFHRWRRGGK